MGFEVTKVAAVNFAQQKHNDVRRKCVAYLIAAYRWALPVICATHRNECGVFRVKVEVNEANEPLLTYCKTGRDTLADNVNNGNQNNINSNNNTSCDSNNNSATNYNMRSREQQQQEEPEQQQKQYRREVKKSRNQKFTLRPRSAHQHPPKKHKYQLVLNNS